MQDSQPGQIISPQGQDDPMSPDGAPQPERPTERPESTTPPPPQPDAAPAEVVRRDEAASPAPQATEPQGWQYHQEDTDARADDLKQGEELAWTASEFIAHEKSAGWYALLALGTVAVTALTYFITGHDKISTGVILLVAIIFGVLAGRPPRVQQYALNSAGLRIGDKTYGYQEFKSFSIFQDGAVASIVLMPLKRFMATRTIYLVPDMEDRVVDVLSARLPMQAHRQDAIDSLLRRIRF